MRIGKRSNTLAFAFCLIGRFSERLFPLFREEHLHTFAKLYGYDVAMPAKP